MLTRMPRSSPVWLDAGTLSYYGIRSELEDEVRLPLCVAAAAR
jgi:hypothetical protein